MFRIDGPGVVTALPAPAAAGTPGYFSGGNLSAGQQPTQITADFLNMLQEEFMTVVLAAGETPDKTNHGQLLAALQALFPNTSGFAFTTDINGNWKRTFPDGVIEIGFVLPPVTTESQFSTVFPFEGFPNQFLGMTSMTINPTGTVNGDTTLQEISSSKTGITLMCQSDGSFTDNTGGFRCIVKGR